IYVFFPEEPKVGVKTLKTYTERMIPECFLSNACCLRKFDTNCSNLHERESYQVSIGSFTDALHEPEFLINVKDHVLVPEHQVLANEEKKTLLERYTVKETQCSI
nr:DNA-directed RNA polymerases II and IV subunit 5A-like [Tanacetum cinerariifolium]